MKLHEAFKTSKQDASSLIWANGTTDKRFDVNGNKFYNIESKGEHLVIDAFHPLFMTHDVQYVFKYVQNHITKDYEFSSNKSTAHINTQLQHGLVVFVKLKPDVRLFDFTDIDDFKSVFGDDAAAIATIFKDTEPYFAFNTALANQFKQYEPIEFSIAKKMAVYLAIDNKWKDASKKEPIQSFFTKDGQSFIQIFTKADEHLFDKTITKDMYLELLDFYKKTLVGAELAKSKTGRDQLVKWGQIWKIFPDTLDNTQLARLNGYFKLLRFCVQYKDLIMSEYSNVAHILDNTNPKKRVSFIDLLQACLYLAIDQAQFSGFWCPEFIGKRVEGLNNNLPSIAITDASAIQKFKSYAFRQVLDAISYAKENGNSSCNSTLIALRDGLSQFKRNAHQKQMLTKKEEQDKKRRLAAVEHFVDDNYIEAVKKLTDHDYDLQKICIKHLEAYKNTFVKSSPRVAVKKIKAVVVKQQIQRLEHELDFARKTHNEYNIERLTQQLNSLKKWS